MLIPFLLALNWFRNNNRITKFLDLEEYLLRGSWKTSLCLYKGIKGRGILFSCFCALLCEDVMVGAAAAILQL